MLRWFLLRFVELAPYVVLAEKLGRLAVQLVTGGSGIQSVKVVYKSARDPDSLDTRLLRAMVTRAYRAYIPIQSSALRGEYHRGRVKYGIPHLTRVGPFSVDVSLDGNLILCKQVDQPGMIGKVGNILGESNVNVSFMSVGRTVKRKLAIMAIGVDERQTRILRRRLERFCIAVVVIELRLLMAGNGIHPYHQQWPPAPVPPPASAAPPHHHHHSMPIDEVRTIFISGLPQDVRREGGSAKDAIQGLVFDTEGKCVLHTEMAKKNLFVKRGIVADSNTHDQNKTYAYWRYITQAPPPYNPYGGYPVAHMPMAAPAPVPSTKQLCTSQNTKDNPPCNTLFIGNLGENINEEELRGLISGQPGFKQMKDVNSATNVHHSLQGAVIPSSATYSKNPFGKRKDFGHPAVAPNANGTPPLTYHCFQDVFRSWNHWIVLEIPLCLCYAGLVLKEGTSFYLDGQLLGWLSGACTESHSLKFYQWVVGWKIEKIDLMHDYAVSDWHWTGVPSSIKSSWSASDPLLVLGLVLNVIAPTLSTSLGLSGYGYSGQWDQIAYLEHLRTIDLGIMLSLAPFLLSSQIALFLITWICPATFRRNPSGDWKFTELTYISLCL
ncbi:hypothetical protein HAX54_025579 [Datura stramonium]|uniref:ACT domain-containing protein n=1 Tax=Datura stramonium TaxID=4076 RepID=A0ABS8S7L0_DATST|nr:hypothetical protein [Datura stramonium]